MRGTRDSPAPKLVCELRHCVASRIWHCDFVSGAPMDARRQISSAHASHTHSQTHVPYGVCERDRDVRCREKTRPADSGDFIGSKEHKKLPP